MEQGVRLKAERPWRLQHDRDRPMMRGEGRSFAVSPPAGAIGVRQWHLGVLPGALSKPLQGSARASAEATDNHSTRFPEQLFSIFSPAGEHSARLGLGGGTIAARVLSAAKVVGIFNFSLPLFSTYQFRLEACKLSSPRTFPATPSQRQRGCVLSALDVIMAARSQSYDLSET